mgnify:FL=1
MAWARLDDQFADHPKVRRLGVFGLALQAAAICFCSRYLTDGFLSWSSADQLIASVMAPFTLTDGYVVTPAVTSGMSGEDASEWDWKDHMVKAGLWEIRDGGYYVHDYLDFNPRRSSVLKTRKKTAIRVQRYRVKSNAESNASCNAIETGAPSPIHTPNKLSPPTYPEGFSEFWRLYPKRIGKGEAYRSWGKDGCEALTERITQALRAQTGYLMREGGRFVPNPATWLNQRRWEDDPPPASPLSPKTQANAEALRRAAIRLKGGDPDAAP